jgi:hypothetical protein
MIHKILTDNHSDYIGQQESNNGNLNVYLIIEDKDEENCRD